MPMDAPCYKVEIDDSRACDHCSSGAYWDIVGPDGVALGRSFGDPEDAEDVAEDLNRAREAAIRESLAAVTEIWGADLVTTQRALLNLIHPEAT
jgi:hypothetical protein